MKPGCGKEKPKHLAADIGDGASGERPGGPATIFCDTARPLNNTPFGIGAARGDIAASNDSVLDVGDRSVDVDRRELVRERDSTAYEKAVESDAMLPTGLPNLMILGDIEDGSCNAPCIATVISSESETRFAIPGKVMNTVDAVVIRVRAVLRKPPLKLCPALTSKPGGGAFTASRLSDKLK